MAAVADGAILYLSFSPISSSTGSCSFCRSFFMVSFQTIYLISLSNQERF